MTQIEAGGHFERMRMKRTNAIVIGAGIAVVAIAVAIATHLNPRAATSPPARSETSQTNDRDVTRLSEQVGALARQLTALQSQLAQQGQAASKQSQEGAKKEMEAPTDPKEIEAIRAADAERRRTFIAGLAQSFAEEKTDVRWAGYASSQISAAFEGDATLRAFAHKIDCRTQTCRVEITDNSGGQLSSRLPLLALGVASVLPSIAADRVDQGNGAGTMVLYMSSRPMAPNTASSK